MSSKNSATATLESLIGRIGIVGVNAVTGVLSARYLHPAGRGELAAMILWPVFLASAITLGVPSATIYRVKRDPHIKSEIVSAGLLLSCLTGVAGVVIGWLFMPEWLHKYSPSTVFYARLLLLNTVPSAILLTGRAALESEGEFRISTALLLGPPVLTLLWLIALAVTNHLAPASAAIAYVTTGIPPFIYLLVLIWRKFHPKLRHVVGQSRLLLSYGIRAYGIDLCGTMALYVDQALVVRLLSPASMGIYVVSLSLSRMLSVFHTSVTAVLFPKAVTQDPEAILLLTGRAVRITSVLTITCALGVMLFGTQLLAFLYGSQYAGAGTLLGVLSLEAVVSGVALVLAQAFMALGRPGIVTIFQTGGLLLTIPAMLVFIPHWGLTGAGLALLCSTVIRLAFVLIGFPLFLKTPCPQVIPGLRDVEWIFSEIVSRASVIRRPKLMKATQ